MYNMNLIIDHADFYIILVARTVFVHLNSPTSGGRNINIKSINGSDLLQVKDKFHILTAYRPIELKNSRTL